MDIESGDIIRLIEQFLKEQNLTKTLEVLQAESSVSLNTVDNIDTFKNDIIKGRWDLVLDSVNQANVSPEKLIDLYEQITIELVENHDVAPARALLRQTEPMEIMRKSNPERYLRLEQMLSRTSFDIGYAYGDGMTRERRRVEIAKGILNDVHAAPPSRLLALIGQALKWQQKKGLILPGEKFDLFYGKVRSARSSEDCVPLNLQAAVKFPKKQHPESLVFSPNGELMATGSVDGFVELWNFATGKLNTDLKYQADGALMMMESSVTCLAFSHSSELLCSGSREGKIKIWKIESGSGYKRFPAAHSEGVTTVAFSEDDTQILSGGFDNVLRIHGLKSGRVLREFQGHSAYINNAIFSHDMAKIISTSADGSVRIWDSKTAACLYTVTLDEKNAGLSMPATHSAAIIPGSPQEFIVCTQAPKIYLVTLDGVVKRVFEPKTKSCKEFLSAVVTPKGKFVFAAADDLSLYCFNIDTGSVEVLPKVTDNEALGMACHPSLCVVALFSKDRRVPIWSA